MFVRIQTKGSAAYELSKKFGAAPAQAVELLQRLHRNGYRLGICFHVGSQIEDPDTYERALASADWVRNRAGVPIAALDVGGGFPADYGHDPNRKKVEMPSLGQMMSRLRADIEDWGFGDMPLVAEPGRVDRGAGFSLIVRVLLRKGARLYINDGIWASLSDSWTGKITLPARFIPDPAIRSRNGKPENIVPFKVCGATCDSVDILSRPFWLPETVDTGDWIEIGHIGAYSLSLRTRFNGFYPDTFVEVETPFGEEGEPEGFASLETMALAGSVIIEHEVGRARALQHQQRIGNVVGQGARACGVLRKAVVEPAAHQALFENFTRHAAGKPSCRRAARFHAMAPHRADR